MLSVDDVQGLARLLWAVKECSQVNSTARLLLTSASGSDMMASDAAACLNDIMREAVVILFVCVVTIF